MLRLIEKIYEKSFEIRWLNIAINCNVVIK